MWVAVSISARPIVRLLARLAAGGHTTAGLGFGLFVSERRAGPPGSGKRQVGAQAGEVEGNQGPHQWDTDTGYADITLYHDPDARGDDGPGRICLLETRKERKSDDA